MLQRGSPESKELHKDGTESDEEQLVGAYAREGSPKWARAGGWRRAVYSHSLLLVMGTIFLLSWLVQSITGVAAYGEQRLRQLQAPLSWADYRGSADFWNRTLQNWQSELLAVASMAVLSIYLRQRGSPESSRSERPTVPPALKAEETEELRWPGPGTRTSRRLAVLPLTGALPQWIFLIWKRLAERVPALK